MLRAEKAALRADMLSRRDALEDRGPLGAKIHAKILALPEWEAARTVSTYVGVNSEVPTIPLIEAALAAGKVVVVPVLVDGEISMLRLSGLEELGPAPYGLLELKPEFRGPAREVPAHEIDFFIVPGLAFDREGGRLGYGKGYYDRYLRLARPKVPLIGIAYHVQIVAQVPTGPTDTEITRVITN